MCHKRRRDEPIAARTRGASAKAPRRAPRGSSKSSDSDNSSDSSWARGHDPYQRDPHLPREVRRTARLAHVSVSSDTASRSEGHDLTSSSSNDSVPPVERREHAQLVRQLLRLTRTQDPDDALARFLAACDTPRCREYAARQAQIQTVPARPLRIQLLDVLPHLPVESARVLLDRVEQIEASDGHNGAKLSEWVRTVLSIPFGRTARLPTGDGALLRVVRALDAAVFGQAAAKDAILQVAAQMMACPEGRPRVVVMVGPPGVGKTTLAHALGEALGLPVHRDNAGGRSDASVTRGHHATYDGSKPGGIINGLIRCGVMNPIFTIDEFDKMSDRGGGPGQSGELAALWMQILDDSQRHAFVDDYVDLPVDLGRVAFVCMANDASQIGDVLGDRLHVVPFTAPTAEEKIEIVRGHVLPRVLRNCGLQPGDVTMEPGDVAHAIRNVRPEPGVRGLGRAIESCVLRLNVLRLSHGGADLGVRYAGVPHQLPQRLGSALYDQLTDPVPRVEHPGHMYI
jgi:hypothetical protein